MKKLILVSAIVLTLTGCATNRQNGELLGALVGAGAGHALGGTTGAMLGSVVGTATGGAIGQNIDNIQYQQQIQSQQYRQPNPIYVQPNGYVHPYWPPPYNGSSWVYVPNYGWGWHHPRFGFFQR